MASGWYTMPPTVTVMAGVSASLAEATLIICRSWSWEKRSEGPEALRVTQLEEMTAAGAAYEGGQYIACDELGRPLLPDWYSGEFARICREAGLPKIRLHDTRGTMNGILEQAGMPDSLRASWLGHTIQANRQNYVPRPKDLTAVSDTIGRVFAAG
jgi:integrase